MQKIKLLILNLTFEHSLYYNIFSVTWRTYNHKEFLVTSVQQSKDFSEHQGEWKRLKKNHKFYP